MGSQSLKACSNNDPSRERFDKNAHLYFIKYLNKSQGWEFSSRPELAPCNCCFFIKERLSVRQFLSDEEASVIICRLPNTDVHF